VIATAAWAAILLGRTPGYDTWLPPLLLVGGIGSAVVLGIAALGYTRHRLVVAGAGVVAAASLLAGPAAYSLTTVGSSTTGALASAGPALVAGGPGGGPGGGAPPGFGGFGGPPGGGAFAGGARPQLPGAAGAAGAGAGSAVPGGVRGALGGRETVSTGLISYLRSHQGSARYLVAVSGSQQSAPIILASGQPVITMGGFNGSDPAPTLAQLQALVSSGQVHYVLLGGGGLGGGGGGFGGPPSGGNQAGNANRSAIQQWVTANGTVVPASAYGGSSSAILYHLG
jgi:hypothetical protein